MGGRPCLCLSQLVHLLPCDPVANVTGMAMLLWTYVHKDMFGGVLWDCCGEWGWRVNGWMRLHLRVHTLSISKFKLNVLVKLICRISKYNF